MAKRIPPTEPELVFQYKTRRMVLVTETIVGIGRPLIWAIVWVIGLYFAYSSVAALAGKRTEANIALKALADLKANQAFAYIFGAGGVLWGVAERKMRKANVARLNERNAKLEKKLDPKRSSSGLPKSGNTRESDSP